MSEIVNKRTEVVRMNRAQNQRGDRKRQKEILSGN